MGNTRLMMDFRDALRGVVERRKANEEFEQQMRERDMVLKEDEAKQRMKFAESDQSSKERNERIAYWDEKQRQNDAFEVAAGRVDPMQYALTYGGGMPETGGGTTRKKGQRGSQFGDMFGDDEGDSLKIAKLRTDLMNDYYTMPEKPLDAEGKPIGVQDYLDMGTKGINTQNDEQAMTPFEARRASNMQNVGKPITDDFRKNVTTSLGNDGTLRFSDNASSPVHERPETIQKGWSSSVEDMIKKRRDLFATGGETALAANPNFENPVQSKYEPIRKNRPIITKSRPEGQTAKPMPQKAGGFYQPTRFMDKTTQKPPRDVGFSALLSNIRSSIKSWKPEEIEPPSKRQIRFYNR